MRRISFLILAAALVVPATASAQQTVNFTIGGFVPRGESGRDINDVLVQDLSVAQPLDFLVSDFHGVNVGGEWLFGIGPNLEGGLGVGYYARTVPSVYANLVNSDGSEIEQDLRLRIVPFTATVRFLPLGNRNGFVPYIGGGVGVNWWRYSETGQFVDTTDNSIYRANYVANGSAVGPVIVGGARYNFDPLVAGFDLRYGWAKGDLPTDQFLGSRIDLSGFNYAFTIGLRF